MSEDLHARGIFSGAKLRAMQRILALKKLLIVDVVVITQRRLEPSTKHLVETKVYVPVETGQETAGFPPQSDPRAPGLL